MARKPSTTPATAAQTEPTPDTTPVADPFSIQTVSKANFIDPRARGPKTVPASIVALTERFANETEVVVSLAGWTEETEKAFGRMARAHLVATYPSKAVRFRRGTLASGEPALKIAVAAK